MEKEIRLVCEWCGGDADTLHEIEDVDAAVGYRGEMDVCGECYEVLIHAVA